MKKREFQSGSPKRKLKQKWENSMKRGFKEVVCEDVDGVFCW